jgi:hypothetical protein
MIEFNDGPVMLYRQVTLRRSLQRLAKERAHYTTSCQVNRQGALLSYDYATAGSYIETQTTTQP